VALSINYEYVELESSGWSTGSTYLASAFYGLILGIYAYKYTQKRPVGIHNGYSPIPEEEGIQLLPIRENES